jgi:2-methylcitrate dehydratase PrpD
LKNLTEQYAEGLYKLSQREFPEQVMKEAKKCLLDYLGVTFVGAHILKEKSIFSLDVLDGPGDIPVIGLNKKSSVQNTVLFNGIHSHYIELDDGHRVAMMHPGAPVISALLPLAQQKKISGKDFLKGMVLGYEASIRLASALQPSLKEKGFHGTGIAGAVGVAAAVATAMKFSEQQFKDAVSAASTSASGILKVIKDVSELKPYNVGNAAQSGYVAAMLAFSGFKGPYDAFGGKLGFLSMFSDNIKESFLEFKETDVLSILKIYRKPYAACRHCHSPIEAALALKESYGLNAEDIKSVRVKTYSLGVAGHEHTEIVGVNSAKMSTPYSIAVALSKAKAGLSEFTEEVINDKEVLSLTQKITVVADDELTALVPQKRAAIVNVEFHDGRVFTQRVDYPKGEPENPISDTELENKFISLAQYAGKTEEECSGMINIVQNIETEFNKLFSYL